MSARSALAQWRVQQRTLGHRFGPAEEIEWLCDQLDAAVAATQIDPAERGGRVGAGHPSTSRRAAARVRRGSQLSALLAVVAANEHTGVTCFEATEPMRRMLGTHTLSRNQVATRMGELRDRGLVHRRVALGGGYVERATEGENTACVWFVSPAGIAERERLRSA